MLTISVIIPMHNEEGNAEKTIEKVTKIFKRYNLNGEIIAVDDRSTDKTGNTLDRLAKKNKLLKVIHRVGGRGIEIGYAIKDGINAANCEVVTIMMGDLSDDPEDIIKMFRKIEEGYDFIVGSRFCKDGKAYNYPFVKLVANRLCNYFIKFLFRLTTSDISNAFKTYRREVLKNIEIESPNFNVTVEIPLKLIKKGCNYAEVPVKWFGRKRGVSKMKVWSDGFMYIKTILKILRGNM